MAETFEDVMADMTGYLEDADPAVSINPRAMRNYLWRAQRVGFCKCLESVPAPKAERMDGLEASRVPEPAYPDPGLKINLNDLDEKAKRVLALLVRLIDEGGEKRETDGKVICSCGTPMNRATGSVRGAAVHGGLSCPACKRMYREWLTEVQA